jgi:hypothetical protein
MNFTVLHEEKVFGMPLSIVNWKLSTDMSSTLADFYERDIRKLIEEVNCIQE